MTAPPIDKTTIDQRRSKLLVIGTAVTMAMVFGKEMDRPSRSRSVSYVVGHILEFTSTSLHTILTSFSVQYGNRQPRYTLARELQLVPCQLSTSSQIRLLLLVAQNDMHESSHNKFLKIPTTGHSQLQKLSCGGGGEERTTAADFEPSTPNSSPP
eukprot:scaffold33526_cov153-Skeletonema_dohrnii-CCMP3373.AAC.5